MLEPPANLPDDLIIASVREGYGIVVSSLTFLPIGNDSLTWVYRAETAEGATYLVKLRGGVAYEASVLVPRYLHDQGVTRVAAPLPALSGASWVNAGAYAVLLYPFIDGTTGTDHGMEERHWGSFGATVRQIHATALTADLTGRMRRDSFAPAWGGTVKRLDEIIASGDFTDPSERELASFWRTRREEIRAILERAERLGEWLRAAEPPMVLCHADMHTWNVMIDAADRLWIIDWDETIVAPKERDLMFVVGGIHSSLVSPREEGWFFAGYGETAVDPLALAYYRYVWAVGDIGAYGEQVFLRPDFGPAMKQDGVQGVMSLFEPGAIVELARASRYPET
jgi:spectinomycin phosphotransferase